jgi:ketosteroid isomerase-like protein
MALSHQLRVAADESSGHIEAVSDLIQHSAQGNAALMQGDVARYKALVPYADDFTLMSPFGGAPSRASDYTPERIEAMGRFFRNGTFEQEVVQTYASADMVVLAVIERTNVEVGGLPAQDWALRVTLVYRRDESGWRLVHRHADPLANGMTLEQAAVLGRGDMASLPGERRPRRRVGANCTLSGGERSDGNRASTCARTGYFAHRRPSDRFIRSHPCHS